MFEEEIIKKREKIEWLNYWIEDADKSRKRILLIGDSVTRQYRKIMNTIVSSMGYTVDLLAMSYSMLDKAVEEEIVHYLKTIPYEYEQIVVQLGAHHGRWIHCRSNEVHRQEYAEKTECLLKLIQEYCSKLVVVAGTPEREQGIMEQLEYNAEIEARNEVMKEKADRGGYFYVDLYWKIQGSKFEFTDHCHFKLDAYEYIAVVLIEELLHIKMPEVMHRINHMVELRTYLEENRARKLYLYGNGYKGRMLKSYFEKQGYEVKGIVVSDSFFDKREVGTFPITDIKHDENNFLIVTPEEYTLWRELHDGGMMYVTLDDAIYEYIEETLQLETKGRKS